MKNSQLITLLSRSSLCEEDIHNVCVIFGALSEEKQLHILGNWGIYLEKLEKEKQKLNDEYSRNVLTGLSQVNTLLDAAIAKYNEKKEKKKEAKRIFQEELKSAIFYDENQKIREIKNLSGKI